MRTKKNNPVENRETLAEYNFRLKELAKSSLVELKKNESKKPIYLIKKN